MKFGQMAKRYIFETLIAAATLDYDEDLMDKCQEDWEDKKKSLSDRNQEVAKEMVQAEVARMKTSLVRRKIISENWPLPWEEKSGGTSKDIESEIEEENDADHD